MARSIGKLHLQSIFIDIHFHALVRKLLQQLHKAARAKAQAAATLGSGHFEACRKGVFLVRACDGKHISVEAEQEIVEDCEGVFRVDNLAYSRCCVIEGFARNVEFHIGMAIIILLLVIWLPQRQPINLQI